MGDKSTLRPWYVHLPREADGGCRLIRTEKGRTHGAYHGTEIAYTVGLRDDEADKDNAALIVRAVNRDHLFGELVEALETLLSETVTMVTKHFAQTRPGMIEDVPSITAARAVLAKVEAPHA